MLECELGVLLEVYVSMLVGGQAMYSRSRWSLR